MIFVKRQYHIQQHYKLSHFAHNPKLHATTASHSHMITLTVFKFAQDSNSPSKEWVKIHSGVFDSKLTTSLNHFEALRWGNYFPGEFLSWQITTNGNYSWMNLNMVKVSIHSCKTIKKLD